MKTKIATLITSIAIVLSASGLTYAAVKTTDTTAIATDTTALAATDSLANTSTIFANIGNINKIEANGNVQVYVISGDKDEVEIDNNYYNENAFVQNEDGVLRITSYKTDTLTVWVTVTDLRAITANYNARVQSLNKLSTVGMDVEINDTASANLNLDAFAANVKVSDKAAVNLNGNVNDLDLGHSLSSTVNKTGLVAANTTEKVLTDDVFFPTRLNRMASL